MKNIIHWQIKSLDCVITSRFLAQYLIKCYIEDSFDIFINHIIVIINMHLDILDLT